MPKKRNNIWFVSVGLVAVFFLLSTNVPVAHAAIVQDTTSSAASVGNVGSLTWSHTGGSGADRILVVGVSLRKNGPTVSGITYGGVALTQIGTQIDGGADHRTDLWYLLSPAVGTANVVVTLAGGTTNIVGGAVSFFGIDQTTPLGTSVGAQGTTNAPSVTVSSATGEVVIDAMTASGDSGVVTAGGGQTQRWSNSTGTGDGDEFGSGSTEAGAGSVTMSWTLTNANKWAIIAVPLKPAAASPPGSTPTPEGTPIGGRITNAPARLYFIGEAYSNATVALDLLDENHNLLRNITSQPTDYQGLFSIFINEPYTGPHFYGVVLRDRAGTIQGVKFYNYDVQNSTTYRQPNIIFPPTMSVSRTSATSSDRIVVSGQAGFQNTVEVIEGDEVLASGRPDVSGQYALSFSLNPGEHRVAARQIDESTGVVSDRTESQRVVVGQSDISSIDFNGDTKIDIADWSIFLFNWASSNETIRLKDDLNGDRVVNVSDFSVFLTSFSNAQ